MKLKIKARSDSKLHGLKEEQRQKLDEWLFGENRSFDWVAERCGEEFNAKVSASGVGRYSQKERARWELERKAKARMEQEAQGGLEINDAEAKYRMLLERMIQIALEKASGAEEAAEMRVVADYAKVFISARREGHEALRAATTRERFEFDAATACLIHQAKVSAIAADEKLDDGARIQRIREELFGENLPE